MSNGAVIDILQESISIFKKVVNSLKNKHIHSNDAVLLKYWSAPEHPISKLIEKKRSLYLSGLGAAMDINDSCQIHKSLFHRNVCYVYAPDLVPVINPQTSQQVWLDIYRSPQLT